MLQAQQGTTGKKYLQGVITLPKEDAEGGVYRTEDLDLANLVQQGYLDVNHLMFDHGISDAVIGHPVEVRVVSDGIWSKFELEDTPLANDAYQYVAEHPGLLGFSIAGGLLKPVFERGGRWLFDKEHGGSVALCRFPMNPGTFAEAASMSATATIFSDHALMRLMKGLATDLRANKIGAEAPHTEWYHYFLGAGLNPLDSMTMASWAGSHFKGLAATKDVLDEIKRSIIVPDEEDISLADGLADDMATWLSVHPDDPHFSDESGKWRDLDSAISHLRYCKRLAPHQVARILGYARRQPSRFFSHSPQGWPEV